MICKVSIGKIYFEHINSASISESIEELSNTATLTLARYYKMQEGKEVLDYIKPGDKVKIELGYEETGGLKTEYLGYVRTVNRDLPLKIECDQLYPLRQNNFVKTYKKVSLKQLLKDISAGTIITKIDSPDADLGAFQLDNVSTFQVLQDLKEKFGLFATFAEDGTLRMGWAWDWKPDKTRRHTYNYEQNVKASDLKYKTKDGFDLRVRVKIRGKSGKEQYVEVGSKASKASVTTIDYAAADAETAKKIAESHYAKNVYDGYTGSITGFGIPRTHAGDSINIQNPLEPGQDGAYLVSKVTINWDEGGYSRINELAYKL